MITSLSLSQLSQITYGQLVGQDVSFLGISTDTRTLKPGQLFVAIRGENFDGHQFAAQALQKGAAAILTEQLLTITGPQVLVKNTRKALGNLAQHQRENYRIPLVALTGSNGKTTTKNMLASILSRRGPVLFNQGNFNNDIGLPLTLLEQTTTHEFAVIEMGTNHFGEIANLTHIGQPDVAMITNIGSAHLEGFGNLEGVARAKGEIFQGLCRDGTAIMNMDQPEYLDYFQSLLLPSQSIITFGTHPNAKVRGDQINLNHKMEAAFTLHIHNKSVAIQLRLLGKHNVNNALAAAAAAHVLGFDLQEIKTGLEITSAESKRLSLKPGLKGARILDDSYSGIPNAIIASLDVLAEYPGERIFVFGGMAELGDNSEIFYREIGEYARQKGIEMIYAVGKDCATTIEAFGQGGLLFANKTELLTELHRIMKSSITVLVKGSRRSRMEEIVAEIALSPEITR